MLFLGLVGGTQIYTMMSSKSYRPIGEHRKPHTSAQLALGWASLKVHPCFDISGDLIF